MVQKDKRSICRMFTWISCYRWMPEGLCRSSCRSRSWNADSRERLRVRGGSSSRADPTTDNNSIRCDRIQISITGSLSWFSLMQKKYLLNILQIFSFKASSFQNKTTIVYFFFSPCPLCVILEEPSSDPCYPNHHSLWHGIITWKICINFVKK